MGDDGTLWGGELLLADLRGYRRLARFGRAPLPGGALAVKRPYRMALGYLFGGEGVGGDEPGIRDALDAAAPMLARLDPREVELIRTQIARRLNAPVASSAGRLFDAAAALLGIRDVAEYEAQAAIDLELAAGDRRAAPLPYRIGGHAELLVYDPRPTLSALLESGDTVAVRAARFQSTIVEVTRELVFDARARTGVHTVCLSGGVFQNRRLASQLLRALAADGFEPFINRQIPVNDGGVSYGQAAIAAARLAAGASGAPGQEG
jgi:hydrogenase maturation protein HypF